MSELYNNLVKLDKSDIYPFHMPGHKRNMKAHPLEQMFAIDITEIDGFDNLHHADGILKRMQDETAGFYGALESYYLVNGSTCGILSAISASVQKGGRLLMARNCHKAAYNACLLRQIDTVYLYPESTNHPLIYGGVSPKEVEQAFEKYDRVDAVIITSPNFDGVVSDIETIAEIVHKNNAILIVDEAHGAHFMYSEFFPKSAVECGADLVIQSLHKTLPSLTQTAILHVCSDRVKKERLKDFLAMYQTSSPSYVFMATMQQCIEHTYKNREMLFKVFRDRLEKFLKKAGSLKHLRVLSEEWAMQNKLFDFDKSKIIVSTLNSDLNGEQLYEILLRRYHLQPEMASAGYVLCITSAYDSEEGFERLAKAIFEIDNSIESYKYDGCKQDSLDEEIKKACMCNATGKESMQSVWQSLNAGSKNKWIYSAYKAFEMEKESVIIEEAIGKVSGEFVYLYPPGIPLLVPGEIISKDFIRLFERCREMRLPLQGCRDYTLRRIEVVKAL